MKFKLIGNIPDQDHIRNRVVLGEFDTLQEVYNRIEEELNYWKDTSNWHRLQQPDSFEVLFKAPQSLKFITYNFKLKELKSE